MYGEVSGNGMGDPGRSKSVIGIEAQVPEEKLQFIMFQQSLNRRRRHPLLATTITSLDDVHILLCFTGLADQELNQPLRTREKRIILYGSMSSETLLKCDYPMMMGVEESGL